MTLPSPSAVRARFRVALDLLGQAGSRVFLNRYLWLLFFLTACAITATGQEVAGAVCFAVLICLALICCDNILGTTLPFLLLCVFVTKCYDSFSIFIGYVWLAVPAVLSLLFHFIVYRKKFILGSTFLPMIGVSIALLVGGLGVLSAEEYFAPTNLYYMFFLGIGMVGAYLLLKPRLRGAENRQYFLAALYVMGMFACFLIFHYVFDNWDYVKLNHRPPDLQASNNLCTLLMFALPCPFLYVKRSRAHLLSAGTMLLAILLTGSRGGILLGSVQFLLCLFVSAIWDKEHRFAYVCTSAAFVGGAIVFGGQILFLRLGLTPETLISKEESRYQMMLRAWDLFREYPIFGHGLGYRGNTDLYNPKTGAMTWYHMIIPQIVASLGCVGILAYGWQLIARFRAIAWAIKREGKAGMPQILTVGLSYSGILLMSLVNPGLFCPIPYALLAVMLLCTVDDYAGKEG